MGTWEGLRGCARRGRSLLATRLGSELCLAGREDVSPHTPWQASSCQPENQGPFDPPVRRVLLRSSGGEGRDRHQEWDPLAGWDTAGDS